MDQFASNHAHNLQRRGLVWGLLFVLFGVFFLRDQTLKEGLSVKYRHRLKRSFVVEGLERIHFHLS